TVIPSTACGEQITRASVAGGAPRTGIDTFVVVPVDTMAHALPAPEPKTSHGRSPAPSATGMSTRRPSAPPASPVSRRGAADDAKTGGNTSGVTPTNAQASLHHFPRPISKSIVRDASVRSVAGDPVRRA